MHWLSRHTRVQLIACDLQKLSTRCTQCSGSGRSPLGRQELRWLCASTYNLGNQLADGGHPAAAAALLQVACNAAVAVLTSASDGLEAQVCQDCIAPPLGVVKLWAERETCKSSRPLDIIPIVTDWLPDASRTSEA